MYALSRTPQQLADSAKARCPPTPQTQEFAEPSLHQLSKDLLSCYSTNSAWICRAFTPQTQQGFTESDSAIAMYTAQRLSVGDTESDYTTCMYTAQ